MLEREERLRFFESLVFLEFFFSCKQVNYSYNPLPLYNEQKILGTGSI